MAESDEEWILVPTSKDVQEPKPATSKGGSSWHPNYLRVSLREKAESLLPKPAAFARLILSSPSTFVFAPEMTPALSEDTDANAEGISKDINLRYRMSQIEVKNGWKSVKATLSWFDGEQKKTNFVNFRARRSGDQGILSCTLGYPPGRYTEEVRFSLNTPLSKEELSALSNNTGGANALSTVNHHRATAPTSGRKRWPSGGTMANGKESYDSDAGRKASGNPSSRSIVSQEHTRTGQISAKNRRSTPSSPNQTNSASPKSRKDPSRKGVEARQIDTSQIRLRPGYVLGLFRERTAHPPTMKYPADKSLCFRGDSDMSHSQILCRRLLGMSDDLVTDPQLP